MGHSRCVHLVGIIKGHPDGELELVLVQLDEGKGIHKHAPHRQPQVPSVHERVLRQRLLLQGKQCQQRWVHEGRFTSVNKVRLMRAG